MNPRTRKSYIVYFGFLLVILGVLAYSARRVVFRPWTARTAVSAVTDAGKIYLFGGRNDQNELLQDVLVIDPARKTLKRLASEATPMVGSAVAALGGEIYLAGGTNGPSVSNRVERFDPVTRSFKRIGALPGPRAYGRLVAAGGRLYYLGGRDGKRIHDAIVEIDPSTGSTRIVGHLPRPLEEFAATTSEGMIYIIGGKNGEGEFSRAIDEIDPASGTIVRSGNLPLPAARMAATTLDGLIYAVGGWNGSPQKRLLRIDPRDPSLRATTVGTIVPSVLDASLCVAGGRLYLIGGTEQRFRRQVQVLRLDPSSAVAASLLLRSSAWW